MLLATNKKQLLKQVQEIKDACRVSAGRRAALARQQSLWIETGQPTGSRALVNKLYPHIDRLSAHLFSPSELRFGVDYDYHYDLPTLSKGEMAGRLLTKEWNRKGLDMLFAAGVGVSLSYGSAILKQMWGHSGLDARIVMPWQFGVYREDINNLEDQEALCETGLMTLPEVWRRISHLPDAEALYKTIQAHSRQDATDDLNGVFFHNVLSTSILNTSLETIRQQPGGVVQLAGNPSLAIVPPESDIPMVTYHEMWVKDDARQDYTTVLLLEPDILISPYYKRENQFAAGSNPYTLIQANYQQGNIWGRSEIVDLMEPQGLLATWLTDIKRLMGVQFDKILAFPGADGITDEVYDQFRASGYMSVPVGSDVKDLTPKLPAEAFTAVDMINKFFESISGFDNIMSGQGAPGVRAANQADAMMRMASPRLRDRSLLVERQCATAGDKTLKLMQSKDAQMYQTDPTEGPSVEFLLHDLPEDARVMVDSHSSSPIFAQDHANIVNFLAKLGAIDGQDVIDLLPVPDKDMLKAKLKRKQEAQAKFAAEHPEAVAEAGKKKR